MIKIEDIKSRIKPILWKYNINRAGIFGSVSRGESTPGDLDILVQIDRKISLLDFIAIKQEIEDEINLKVDLVEYSTLKPAIRNEVLEAEIRLI